MAKKQTKQLMPVPQSKVSLAIQQEANRKFPLRLKLAFFLGFISIIIYANTLKNGYVLDDFNVIKGNTLLAKGISAIPELLSTPYRHGYINTYHNDIYRPLSLVMFAVEYQVSGGSPAISHFFNIFVFAGCVMLLFFFIDSFIKRKNPFVAFITSLLFALHPIHTETVANIKSRDELLCFFFSFLSLNIFIKYVDAGKIKQLLLGLFCFFLSLLSKETTITLLAIIPLIFFFYINENKKRSAYITIGVLITAIIFLVIRASVLSAYNVNHSADISFIDNFLTGAPSPAIRLATELEILGFYLKLLLIPYPLICDYSYNSIPFVGFNNIVVLLSLTIYSLLIFFSILGLIKSLKDPFVFAILFFLVTITLFSNIPFLIGTPMGERLLFFPSVGFCLIAALLTEKWVGEKDLTIWQMIKQPKVLGIIIPLSCIYSFITINRNNDWKDDSTIYATDIKKMPANSRLNNFVGVELHNYATNEEKDPAIQKRKNEEAITYLKKSLEIYPKYLDANYNLGTLYYNINKYEYAIYYLKKAIAIDSGYSAAYYNIGGVYFNMQRYDSAEACYKKVLIFEPGNVKILTNLGVIYSITNKFTQAIEQLKKAIAIDPGFSHAYFILGGTYFDMQQYQLAIDNFSKGFFLDPQDVHYTQFMAIAWQKLGKMDSAKKYEYIAQKNNPGFKL